MVKRVGRWISERFHGMMAFPDYTISQERYKLLRRRLMAIGVLGTMLPLLLMAVMNHYQYKKALKNEIVEPMRVLVNKTKHSFELFLTERVSAVSFIASAYPYEELADEKALNRIFMVMKKEFGGFVDLGLINSTGHQVSYTGPYNLKGKDYSNQAWFHEARVRGTYISDVFMGYRKFPHLVIAVEHQDHTGNSWIIRATIDTDMFNNLIASMGLEPAADAFVLNREGVLQTPSKFCGKVLEKCPLPLPPRSQQPNVLYLEDQSGKDALMSYAYFENPSFVLVLVKPQSEVLKAWYTVKSEFFFLFVLSVLVICVGAYLLTDVVIKRIEESDQERFQACQEMGHQSKLASVGRLAAGVAHEVNNPLAVIREKAGLIKDLIEYDHEIVSGMQSRNKFLALAGSIQQSVDRCKAITRRLLGFARRMDVEIEPLSLADLMEEVLGFLEQEAFHREIDVQVNIPTKFPEIRSDRGQLQQVFLNIITNAFAAMDDGGKLSITGWEEDPDTVGISIQDNGYGMSPEVAKNIFEPFYTTKREGEGTGLGLSISYGIIKRLGGEIKVESQEGKGTTFTLLLPKRTGEGAV